MSVRFAPARNAAQSPIAKVLTRGVIGQVANDYDGKDHFMSDTTQAALRHFADHGLRAVSIALNNATLAATAAQTDDMRYWLGICRELDAGAAARFEASHATPDNRQIG